MKWSEDKVSTKHYLFKFFFVLACLRQGEKAQEKQTCLSVAKMVRFACRQYQISFSTDLKI